MAKHFCFWGVLLVLGAGCASVETRLPVPDQSRLDLEQGKQEDMVFVRYEAMASRLDYVSSQVLRASRDLCPKTKPEIGLVTHTKKSYPKYLRDAAQQRLGVDDDPSVLIVREHSLAARAGIMPGDIVVDDEDEALSTKQIGDNLQAGTILKLRRTREDLRLHAQAQMACAYNVQLKFSAAVNAYATGRSIIVTTGMMDFTQSDEELALVIGHELAHNTMGHVRKSIQNTILSGFARRYTRPFEAEADYVGLYYMALAGYKLDGVETFWRRLGVRYPKNITGAKSHPVTPERLLAIRLARVEVTAKQEAGIALVPNFTKEQNFGD